MSNLYDICEDWWIIFSSSSHNFLPFMHARIYGCLCVFVFLYVSLSLVHVWGCVALWFFLCYLLCAVWSIVLLFCLCGIYMNSPCASQRLIHPYAMDILKCFVSVGDNKRERAIKRKLNPEIYIFWSIIVWHWQNGLSTTTTHKQRHNARVHYTYTVAKSVCENGAHDTLSHIHKYGEL